MLETKCLHSLEKVFPDDDRNESPYSRATALRGEQFSFQVAYRNQSQHTLRNITARVSSGLSGLSAKLSIRHVGLVPSEFPCYPDHDEHIIRSSAGLFPDPLHPIPESGLHMPAQQWRSVWISVELSETTISGTYPIVITFEQDNGELLAEETFELEIIPATLPEQKLIHTEWFHTDCLSNYYEVEVFSEAHWSYIEKYIQTAVRNGMNMLLTPLFTPPLDTKVGGERPTVQLVDVLKDGDTYSFSFERLQRWIEICDRSGMRYFEFSHLFTQWGAKHAPKIVAAEKGSLVQIFGWDTDATGDSYKSFLNQLLPALVSFLKEHELESRSYFHISDEPSLEHLPWYKSASEIMQSHLSDFPIIDALSNIEFYQAGLVENPIPGNNHIEPFLESGVSNLWTYYCCVQYKEVSNRFFNMPSARNRIMGLQMYKFAIKGFLHWGYNFWNAQYSERQLNPFLTTDADYAFPSGDSFLVYPGEEGPIESLRMVVFHEALQDMRALELLESLVGREQTLALLEEGLSEAITFDSYPREAGWLLSCREKINQNIKLLSVV
ncbi:hypothetical protein Back11_55030 [Paenibacillus baekrokdamisoli]|uniref:Uncharacterized protein n=1 Tax=Paenibacillus baekrokdamisoli TaxID=1712516 RepID=A0A3G9JJ97_9BACL|nr:DUF4091 domain-containing protein [Paenibacillus baekrokdamisoli]MBB3071860.1 hypothetical protein [Paenibacillus baekrokdamisoli]BBH24158.1 hypothetical protein Back11_55030 [Paenibacillus baekrokdamisoli]